MAEQDKSEDKQTIQEDAALKEGTKQAVTVGLEAEGVPPEIGEKIGGVVGDKVVELKHDIDPREKVKAVGNSISSGLEAAPGGSTQDGSKSSGSEYSEAGKMASEGVKSAAKGTQEMAQGGEDLAGGGGKDKLEAGSKPGAKGAGPDEGQEAPKADQAASSKPPMPSPGG